MRSLLPTSVFCLLLAGAKAADVAIDWTAIYDNGGPQTATATVGDTVTFTWSEKDGKIHNIYKNANKVDYDACAKTDGTMEAPDATSGTWSWTPDAAGTFYFICEVGSHCSSSGQKVAVTVSAAASDPCFPSSATVILADGSSKRVDALLEGDEIVAAAADGTLTTDTVSLLSIAQPEAHAAFFLSLTSAANTSLTLTPEHHVPVGPSCCSTLKQAKDLQVGDTLWVANANGRTSTNGRATSTSVTAISKSQGHGLHSPVLTRGGFPVVDGVVTSFDSIEKVTLAKHGLEPLITACKATNMCEQFRALFLAGDRKYVDALRRLRL